MNTYKKYAPNVFVAKCDERHEKGSTIIVETRHGKENECIVFNLVGRTTDGSYCYSIVRADGFNVQEWAKRRAEKYLGYAESATAKSSEWQEKAKEGRDFLSLGEPIKIGHHSEKRHRALIDRNWNRIGKSVEFADKAEDHKETSEYWEKRSKDINLSMPESLEMYEYKYEEAREYHEGLKSGKYPKQHSFDVTYANKAKKEMSKKLELAKKLWGEN